MSKINNYIMDQVEKVEKEFKNIEYDILFDMVYTLVLENENYHYMNEMDQFDYLVDNILVKQWLYTNDNNII